MSASIRLLLAQNDQQIRLLEAHDRNSTELIRKNVSRDGQSFQGLWISGLTQTTYLGLPDTELISPLKRACMIASNNVLQKQENRPLCAAFDADSGGDIADIPALVAVLEILGVSMIIIEDKALVAPGEKANSLGSSSVSQPQADMYEFAKTIKAFKAASENKDMTITARIESLTTRVSKEDPIEERDSIEDSINDALARAYTYKAAGTDAIMIHSKSKEPDEVITFLRTYRSKDKKTTLVVVPTTYSRMMREDLYKAGANVIIYANHLMRAKISAVDKVTKKFLADKPDLFSDDQELSSCVRAQNYGCLLQKLSDRRSYGEVEENHEEQYRLTAEKHAYENMDAVVKDLVDGNLAGCEADERMITVKELLKINAQQIVGV